jgi:predicted transcriptional regulator
MPVVLKSNGDLKAGDRLEFRATQRAMTVKAVEPSTYKATKAELAAIREGEAEIARGESVNIRDLLNGLEHRRARAAQRQLTRFPANDRKISRRTSPTY